MLLVDLFLQKMETTTQSLLKKRDDPLVRTGNQALLQGVRMGEKIYFTAGTTRMLTEKLEHYEETIKEVYTHHSPHIINQISRFSSERGTWVEFHTPLAFPTPISAMFLFVPAQYLITGQDRMQLFLIDQFADLAFLLTATPGGAWTFAEPFHRCPRCRREYGLLLPCDPCQAVLLVWSHILVMSALVAGQYLATIRYEEKEMTSLQRLPRQKNGKKSKTVIKKYLFKIIDASEIIIPLPTPGEEEARVVHQPGDSWLIRALEEGNLVRTKIRTHPFAKTYRDPRYVNVQGTTVEYPEGIVRMQPMLKENVGKYVTKVKSSAYGEE